MMMMFFNILGVRNMARAYGALSSTNKRDSLAHVKYGYKECTQVFYMK